MPRMCWSLRNDRPCIQVKLVMPNLTSTVTRTLLADIGAGPLHSPFELIFSESDCRQFGRQQTGSVSLGGAYRGIFPFYSVRIEISALSFGRRVTVVPVPDAQLPIGFNGIAVFRFINRFTYGNFGNPNQFCLETL